MLPLLRLHLEFKYFFYKSDTISWRAELLTFQWQVNCWMADRRHQRHVSRPCHPFPSPDYLTDRVARQFFFRPSSFFSFFFPMRILVPGYKLYISNTNSFTLTNVPLHLGVSLFHVPSSQVTSASPSSVNPALQEYRTVFPCL